MTNEIKLRIAVDGAEASTKSIDQLRSSLNDLSKNAEMPARASGSWRQLAADFAHVGQSALFLQQAFSGVAGAVSGTVSGLIAAQQAADKLKNTLEYSAGLSNVAREMEYLRNVTRRLGVDYQAASEGYSKFSAAVKGSGMSLEQTRTVFEGVAQATAKFGLSAGDAQGVFLALSQMASKGVVSAEEMRGQLAERLPGALRIAADAMGVTTAQFSKMLETGQVIASDFLPKFGAALKNDIAAPANSLTQEINRLTGAWEQWKQSMANADGGGFAWLTNGLNESAAAMRTLGSEAGVVQRMLVAIGGFELGSIGQGKFDTAKLQQDAMAQLETVIKGRRAMEGKLLNYLEQENLRDLKRQEAELRATIEQLGTKVGKIQMPDLKEAFAAQAAKRKALFDDYMKSVKSEKDKQVEEENARFVALTAIIGTSGKDYEEALSAHRAKLAEINKKGSAKGSTNTNAAAEAERRAWLKYLDDEAEAEARAVHALNVYYAERQKVTAGWVQDEQKRSLSLADGNTNLQEQYDTLGMSTEALARYRVEKLEAAAASDTVTAKMLEEAAAHLNELNVLPDVAQAYRELAAAKRESAGQLSQQAVTTANLAGKQIAVDAAKASSDEWKRFSNDIERSLTDALMRSFEAGESFGDAFIKNLKNALKTSAIKVVINAVVGGTGSIVGSLGNSALNAVFGTGGSNGGSGTDYLGIASNAKTVYGAYGAYQAASAAYGTGTGLSASEAAAAAYQYYLAGDFGTGVGLQAGSLIGSTGAAYGAYTASGAYGTAAAYGMSLAPSAAGYGMSVAPTVAAEGASVGLGTLGVYAAVFAAVANLIGNAGTRPTQFDNVELFGNYKDGELQGGEIGTQFKAAGGWVSGEKIYQASKMPLTYDSAQIAEAFFGGTSLGDTAIELGDQFVSPDQYISEVGVAGLSGAKIGSHAAVDYFNSVDRFGAETESGTDPIKEQMMALERPHLATVRPITTDPKVLGYIGDAIEAIFQNTQTAFTNLAQSFDDAALVERIADFEMSISTTGTTIEEMMTKVATSATQQMQAAFLPSIDGLRKAASADGKTAAETWDQAFNRVMIEVSATSRILDLMGTSLKEAFTGLDTNAALASIDALNQLFGGADQLTTAFNAYYDNFFTEEEKRANAIGEMSKAFTALNLEMPDSRAGFKALVEGLDLATASGQLTFKALMDLQGGFAELYPVIEDTSTAIADLRKSLAEKYAAPLTLDQAKLQITAAGGASLLDATSLEAARQMLSDFISTTTSDGLNAVQALEPALDLYLSSLIDQKTAAENAATAIENATNGMRSLGDSLVAYDEATSGDKGALGRQLADAFAGLGLTMPTSVSDYRSLVAEYRGPDDTNVKAYSDVLGTLTAISQSIAAWTTNDPPIFKVAEEYLNNKGTGTGALESPLAGDGYSQSDSAAWMTKYSAAANPAWVDMAQGITDFVKNNLGVDFDASAWDSVATAQTQLAAAISAIGNDSAKLETLVGLFPNIEKYFATAPDTTPPGPSPDDLANAIANALGQLRDISHIGLDQNTIAQREATRLTTEAKSQFQTPLKDVDLSSVKSLQAFAASLDATDVASQPLIESLSALASALYQVEAAAKQATETAKDQQRGIAYLELDSNVVAKLETARLANAITAEFGRQVASVDFTSLPSVQAFAASLDAADPAAQKLIASLSELGSSMSRTSQAAKQALLQTAQTNANNAYSALERAVDAERKTIQSRIEASQEQVSSLTSIFDTLESGIAQLRSASDDNVQAEAVRGRAFISDALSTVLASGYLPDPDELSKAVSAAIKGQERQIFASQAEAAFQSAVLAGQMEKLKDVAGDQKTVAELTLEAAEDQLKFLDDLLTKQKKLLDAANGIDVSVQSMRQAVEAVAIAVGNLAIAQQVANQQAVTTTSIGPEFSTHAAAVSAFSDSSYQQVVASIKSNGPIDVGTPLGWAVANDPRFPRFAVGANRIPEDMVAMIHKDEAIIPAAFNPWLGQNNGAPKDDKVARLIESLLAQNQRLEDRLMAIETHTRRTFATLDNVTEGGNAMRQVAA